MPSRSFSGRMAVADTWLLELFLGLYTLLWGLAFLNPLTDAFSAAPRGYLLIGRFPGGEAAFGGFASAVGALALLAMLRGSRKERALAVGSAGVFWLLVTVAVGVPTEWSAGGLVHFGLAALANWFSWARLRRQGVDG